MTNDQPFQVDLTNCDREPIHIPGSIQPHGLLLAITEPAMTIVQVSANTFALLGRHPRELLGQPLSCLFEPPQLASLQECLAGEQFDEPPIYTLTLPLGPTPQFFDVIAHRMQGRLILELEPAVHTNQSASLKVYRMVKGAVTACQRTASVREFAQVLASSVRKLTGFDRVMVYQFQADDSGVVIAEEMCADLPSYRDLHYPASDIPKQARALYLRNWLRIIPTVTYQPVPLLARDDQYGSEPLDMSFTGLRSVSPIHIEYLINMGVSASMSISLIKDNHLWGLVACHHYHGSHGLPYDIRAACEFLGHVVSLQIADKEATEDTNYTLALQATQVQLVQHMSIANDIVVGLTRFTPNLLDFLNADGAAVCLEGQCVLLGKTPPQADVWQLIDWLTQQVKDDLFVTASLAQHYPVATGFKEVASGLLAVRLARAHPNYLLWFRPEVIQTVAWGGNPHKPVEITPAGARLSPRRSFETWKQTVQETARPWRPSEIAAAHDLRRATIDLVLYKMEELARLNEELTQSNVELDSFAYVASHDLKEPLRGLHNYAHFLIEDYADQLDAEGRDKLATLIRLTQRMEALIDTLLHYSRVGRADLTWVESDLNDELTDVLSLLESRLHERDVEIRIPRPLPRIRADQTRMREVFSNLITNAIKYNDKPKQWIEITYTTIPCASDEEGPPQYLFSVRDNGIGIPEEHQENVFRIFKRLHGRDEYGGGVGAGLTIVKKIIERHGGSIWIKSQPGEGATFFFTLAKCAMDRATLSDLITLDGNTEKETP